MEKQQIDYKKLSRERIITIADLIGEIFRKLWIVIIVAVIFALLLGGYKYMKDSKTAQEKAAVVSETASKEKLKISSSLSEDEQKEVDNILLIQDNLTQQQEYAANSVLMQIDPFHESNGTLHYYFEVDNPDEQTAQTLSYNLLNSYQNYVENGALVADLRTKGVELNEQYISELLSCTVQANTAGNTGNTTSSILALNTVLTTFDIKIIHADNDSCRELTEKVEECIQEYKTNLDQNIGEHDLVLVDQSYAEVVDRTLWTFKYDRANNMIAMQERINNLEEGLSAEQLDVINRYTEILSLSTQAEDAQKEPIENTHVSVSKKYVLAGAAGGFILACLIIIISYIMRGSVHKAEDLQYLYNIRILGELDYSGRKKFLAGLWNKMTGKKTMELSEQQKLLAANLEITCEKMGIGRILVSADSEKELVYVKEALKNVGEKGISLEYVTDLMYSSETFQRLAEYDTIILVEQIGKSQYSDVIREIEICTEQQVQILGAVVMSA